jgi:hypothetical protein
MDGTVLVGNPLDPVLGWTFANHSTRTQRGGAKRLPDGGFPRGAAAAYAAECDALGTCGENFSPIQPKANPCHSVPWVLLSIISPS